MAYIPPKLSKFFNKMADISSWEEKLSKHAIFKVYESKSKKNGNYQQHKSILAENDGQIFIWNNENGQIMTMNLKNLHFRNDRADRFQVFLCTSAPVFDVHSLLFSVAAKYIAIIGDHGITVLEVPQRWGKFAEYENGKDRINCRTIKADERYFTSHQSIKILDVKWHPGSWSDSHLVVLTSDNKLRIINILKPEAAEQVIPLGVPFSSTAEYTKNSISSTSAFAAALGETSIGFDFAPAINDLNQRNRKSESDLIHPVFVLRENGDVYYLLFRLYKECSNKELIGPLSIYPAADDNYGLDACSIACLQSKPPVIVMATASGRLYHCVVLESWVGEENNEETVIQELPFGNKRRRSYEKSSLDLSLFVHECIDLQSMPTENEESSAVDRAVSPASDDTECDNPLHITVLKDPVMTHHYHCTHLSGVHSITLTWMRKLEEFCTTDAESTDLFTSDEAAVVYHMICTSPRPLSHPAPVQGLAVVSDRLLGPALLCITQSMECIVRPLNALERSLPLSLDNQSDIGKQNYQSPMKYLTSSGSFLDFIKNILTRKMSTPLLKAGKSCADMSQQELYEIFVKEQHILRTEYIQKQSSAKEEIRKRSSMLQEQKDKQIEDLQNLDKEREELQQKAFDMADKLEDITEKNETLLKRIQKLFIEIQSGVPILSDSEKRMKEDLENIQQHMKFFKSSLAEVKTKTDWSTQKSKRTKSYNLPVVTGVQQERIREFIHQENEMITEIVNQIKTLKLQVGV